MLMAYLVICLADQSALLKSMSFRKKCPDWLPLIELRSYLQTVSINKQKVLHNNYPQSSSTSMIIFKYLTEHA